MTGTRSCGGCSLCCKVLGVPEIEKARNSWCQHVALGLGCGIYDKRPEACKAYQCLWLQDKTLPDNFRPDLSHVILGINEKMNAITAYVDTRHEDAWREGEMGKFLRWCGDRMPVIIVVGDNRKIITSLDPNRIAIDEPDGQGVIRTLIPKLIKIEGAV